MLYPGLVSVTFRALSPKEIIDLVVEAGLVSIEWGGDVHVPHGDVAKAKEVRQMTEEASLKVAAYGSYYAVGDETKVSFDSVLASAVGLGAPIIRVWAGDGKASKDMTDKDVDLIVTDSRRVGEMAAKEGVIITYEFHKNTLTDTNETTKKLLEDVGLDNIRVYWQPIIDATPAYCLDCLKSIHP